MKVLAALPLAGCMLWRGDGARCDRPIELGLQADVTAFASCQRAGTVTVRTGAPLDLSPLHRLETIAGDLVIGPTVGVDTVNLSGLRTVGGTVRIADNGLLSGVFLPALERAGRVDIEHNAALATVAKELAIVGHPRLTFVEARHLARAESLRLDDNPVLPPEIVEQLRATAAPP